MTAPATAHSAERCETCRFCMVRELIVTVDGVPNGETYAKHECRRNPPTLYIVEDWSGSQWPEVDAADWCGEFSPKAEG